MKNLLYDLPKEILIELLEKTYNFDSIPLEDVFNISNDIKLSFNSRIEKEKLLKRKILDTKYQVSDIEIYFKRNKIS